MPTILAAHNELELNQAIATVDGSATGNFVIQLTANITLGTDTGQTVTFNGQGLAAPAELYAVNLQSGVTLTIDGAGDYIDGSSGGFNLYRGLFVYAGDVTIQNLSIQNTKAKGGDGINGGGGGAGLGGGLYVANDVAHGAASAGRVTLDNVNFSNNNATGGTTDYYSNVLEVNSGGGGGMGGYDGRGIKTGIGVNGDASQGGGGIGSTADGGNEQSAAYGGIVLGAAPGGAGIDNAGRTAGKGGANGGGGGGTPGPATSTYAGGGGGVGGQAATSLTQGGAGGYGGGGGEAAAGGFGGGGGSGGSDTTNAGGNGGFGGGGGGGTILGGAGGFGAGAGSSTAAYTGGGGLGAGGAIFVQAGASLTYKGGGIYNGSVTGGAGATAGSAYGAGIFLQGDETITFAPTAGETLTISSNISDQTSSGGTGANAGVGRILISGAGTVAFTGTVNIAGGVSVGAGATISAETYDSGNNVTNLGNGTITLDGGTLRNDTGASVTVRNPIVIAAGGGTINTNGQSTYLSGPLSGAGTLTFLSPGGAHKIGLEGDNHAFTGTSIVTSNVALDAYGDNVYAPNSAFIVNGTLNLNGHSETIGSLSDGGGSGGSVVSLFAASSLTVGGDGTSTTFSGTIAPDVQFDRIALVKIGAGTLTLTGADTLSDGLTIGAGSLQVGAGGTSGSISGNVLDNAALIFNRLGTNTFSGSISGSGSLQQLGANASASLILSGANTYTGATTVSAGTLVDEGSSVSATTVKNGATLSGGGTAGAVTVDSGGQLSPGSPTSNQVGTLSTGSLKLNPGSTLLDNLNGTATGSFGQVKVTGTVDISGATLTLNTTDGYLNSIAVGTSFEIIDNDGTDAVTGTFGNANAQGDVLITPASPSYGYTQAYRVNTHGGDGNDVVITMINTQPNLYNVPGAQTVASGSNLAFSGSNAIHEADADQGQTITATLAVSHGMLTTSGTAAVHSGDGTGTMTITGAADAVDTTLQTLVYQSNAGYGGSDALAIAVKDDSNASNATATALVQLTVTPPPSSPGEAPTETIGSVVVAGDDVVNAAEAAGATVPVSGTLSSALAAGEHINVTLGGTVYAASVSGTSFSAAIPTPAQAGSVSAQIISASGTGGQAVSQAFTVDTTSPTVTASATSATVQATSAAGAVENFTAMATDAVDGSSDPVVFTEQLAGGATQVVHSGDVFGLGTHTIVASATDKAGNTGTAAPFSFSVVDTTAPVVTASATAATVQATSATGAAETFAASSSDAVDGSSDPVVFTEQLAGGATQVVHSGDVFGLGTHTIVAAATDKAGNTGTAAPFSFSVVDTTAPVVTASATAATVQATSATGAAETFAASSSDAVDGSSDPVVFTEQLAGGATQVVHSGDVFGLGTHTIVAAATDKAGNTGTAAPFSFSVVDTTAPVVTASATAATVQATSATGAAETFAASSSDAVDGSSDPVVFTEMLADGSTRTVRSGDTFAIGSHTIVAAATDKAGNTGTAPPFSFSVVGSVVNLIGTGLINYVDVTTLPGAGQVIVDLLDGSVSKGGVIDATLSNIQGVQLGADPAVVLGAASGTDLIYGGSGSLAFYGEGAHDVVHGGTGTNAVVAGVGNTEFYSGNGNDTMLGSATGSSAMVAGSNVLGVDTFYGNGGSDFVFGGAGTTNLIGGGGTEVLHAGSGNALMIGLNHPDAEGRVGTNVLIGGTGTDLFYGGIGTNILDEGSGLDIFAGGAGTDLIYGGTGRSFIFGGSGTDVITTGAGNQYVKAGSGQTVFNDTAANLHAGRFDQIDNFTGGQGTNLYLPAALQGATSFVAQNGGTAVLTAVNGGTAELFASNTDLATVQSHTHFTL